MITYNSCLLMRFARENERKAEMIPAIRSAAYRKVPARFLEMENDGAKESERKRFEDSWMVSDTAVFCCLMFAEVLLRKRAGMGVAVKSINVISNARRTAGFDA